MNPQSIFLANKKKSNFFQCNFSILQPKNSLYVAWTSFRNAIVVDDIGWAV